MTNKIRPELLEKAKAAASAEELMALAKESGVEMTAEEAKAYFDRLHWSGELSDEELANVSGGFLKEYDPRPLGGGEVHKAQREK